MYGAIVFIVSKNWEFAMHLYRVCDMYDRYIIYCSICLLILQNLNTKMKSQNVFVTLTSSDGPDHLHDVQ